MAIASALSEGSAPGAEHRLHVPAGQKNLRPMAELVTKYYLRVPVVDRPGAMAQLSGVLAKHGISIGSMIQKGEHPAGRAEVIIVTQQAREGEVQAALKELAGSEIALEAPFVLRVEEV